jgi:ABC-type lipoprotein export system ATPase subunit
MTIGFYHVTPAPLAGVIDFNTEIWQSERVFEPGAKYRIVAPSGKGKTTFIHYIYGLRHDYSGTLKIGGQDVRTFGADAWADLRQSQFSIVYQDIRLFLNLTAAQNLQVKAALYKKDPGNRIAAMAETLGVAHVLHKKCHTLSYGERQRVAIIRSLIQPFTWLLLDEPFSHLDHENARKAAILINAEAESRRAGVIVTSLGQDNFFNYDQELQL